MRRYDGRINKIILYWSRCLSYVLFVFGVEDNVDFYTNAQSKNKEF